jgi:hypothetical protein
MSGMASTANARRRLRILRRPTESIRPSSPRPQRRDCHGRLIAALLAFGGDRVSLANGGFRPRCSATFIGAQHRLTLRIDGEDAMAHAGRLASQLPEAELPMPGHIVADVAIDAIRDARPSGMLIDLAVLTIEDW